MSDFSEKKQTLIVSVPSGKPAPEASSTTGALVLIHPSGVGMGRRFDLLPAGSAIGRLPDLEVPVDHEGVSRRHARAFRDAAGWFIEDEGSTNGTFVNDRRITRQALADGDLVRVGVAILKFLAGSQVEAAYHEAIYKMAIHDALTGIPNRRMLLEFLDREISRSLRYKSPLSLALLDIDHFKKINDEHGHLAGDAVLREMGSRLRPRVRREDLVARYGGEEFACVLVGTDRIGGLVFAKSVLMTVGATPFTLDKGPLRVTVSIGVAEMDGSEAKTADQLIKAADEKLYLAKKNGRNRIEG